jgi:trk system potassium uptake protein TrkH
MVRQRVRLTLHIIGSFLKYLALVYVFPLVAAIHYGEVNPLNGQPNWLIYLYSLVLTLGVGLVLELAFKTDREIERTDGFTVVAFTWLLIPVFGMIPYLFLGLQPLDALFEAVSGFTTTGASILVRVEDLPNSALLWRSLTQWLGGMGVIALFIAILPRLGVGGSQLFDREATGPMPERLRPRFATTARMLWTIYAAFTGAEIVFLHFLSRLPLFDSICISFTTVSTGGFTPTTAGIGGYGNPAAEYIIIFFMFLGGTNFLVHSEFFRGNFKILRDEEFRLYVILLLAATGLLVVSQGLGLHRAALFQAVSIMTCTGFSTANFATWAFGGQIVLLMLMFIGASGGSTGGGLKVSRVLTLIKHTGVMMRKAITPNAVIPLKYNRRPLPDAVIRDVTSFVFLYLLVAILSTVALGFLGLNLETALSAVATCLANCGPGLGAVGPFANFALLPAAAKSILIACMWLGRLELFTLLMIFFPRFWRV